jgi:hypothetical protein
MAPVQTSSRITAPVCRIVWLRERDGAVLSRIADQVSVLTGMSRRKSVSTISQMLAGNCEHWGTPWESEVRHHVSAPLRAMP